MFAMLLAMTSRLVCWAFMPVAAMRVLSLQSFSDAHAADFEIGGNDLVANGDCRLKGLLGAHDGIDHLSRVGVASERLHRHLLGILQGANSFRNRLAERLGKRTADTSTGDWCGTALKQIRRCINSA